MWPTREETVPRSKLELEAAWRAERHAPVQVLAAVRALLRRARRAWRGEGPEAAAFREPARRSSPAGSR
jgi:hypothetical protein